MLLPTEVKTGIHTENYMEVHSRTARSGPNAVTVRVSMNRCRGLWKAQHVQEYQSAVKRDEVLRMPHHSEP